MVDSRTPFTSHVEVPNKCERVTIKTWYQHGLPEEGGCPHRNILLLSKMPTGHRFCALIANQSDSISSIPTV